MRRECRRARNEISCSSSCDKSFLAYWQHVNFCAVVSHSASRRKARHKLAMKEKWNARIKKKKFEVYNFAKKMRVNFPKCTLWHERNTKRAQQRYRESSKDYVNSMWQGNVRQCIMNLQTMSAATACWQNNGFDAAVILLQLNALNNNNIPKIYFIRHFILCTHTPKIICNVSLILSVFLCLSHSFSRLVCFCFFFLSYITKSCFRQQ